MDARTKAVKTHRKRLRLRRMRRVEVTVREDDAPLIQSVAKALRGDDASAKRARAALRAATKESTGPTVAEAIRSLPDISGPEFDQVFNEIERFRHHPMMLQVRDVDL
jgi:hypothetical protein